MNDDKNKKQLKSKKIYDRLDIGYGPFDIISQDVRAESLLHLIEHIAVPLSKALHLIVYREFSKGGGKRLTEQLVPMPDGAKIATDVYLPKEVYKKGEKAPTILIRTPYWKDSMAIVGYYMTINGYVAVIQDIRGTGHSNPYGNNSFFFSERYDGLETLKWIKNQSWYNKMIGMWGASYLGLCEWAISYDNEKMVQCMLPGLATPHMIWSAHNGLDILGIGIDISRIFHETTKFYDPIWKFSHELTHRVTSSQLLNPKYALYNEPVDLSDKKINLDKDLKGKSFLEVSELIPKLMNIDIKFNKQDFPKFQNLLHQFLTMKRAHFLSKNMAGMLDYDPSKLEQPVLILSGWYDMFSKPCMEAFTELQEKAPRDVALYSKIVVGPWAHGDVQIAAGNIWNPLFSPGGWLDFVKTFIPLKFYQYWLRDIKNDLYETGPVKIFVMKKNEWRYEKEWPLKRAVNKTLYLHSNGEFVWKPFGGGNLSFNFPKEREVADEYDFNPMNPVITCGGTNLNLPKGIKNQKVPESREDTLIYTSAPLTRGMEVTGNVVFNLYAESDAEDTDFMIKLCDVSPLGKSINVLDLGIRARFRDLDYQHPKLLEPGKIYHYTIPLGPTSYYFNEKHRIRIDITSSDWPKYNINSNMGGKGGKYDYKIAHQKIYHNADNPSNIVLPLIEDYFHK